MTIIFAILAAIAGAAAGWFASSLLFYAIALGLGASDMEGGLAMGAELERLNTLAERQGLPIVRMRMGINTGLVVVGTLGSAERMKYTTVGDAVNIASRLANLGNVADQAGEPQKNHYRLLVSGDTLRYLDDTHTVCSLGSFTLKGKQEPVSVYQITEGKENSRPEKSKATA